MRCAAYRSPPLTLSDHELNHPHLHCYCHCSQVGIRLDEPSGLNNGTAKGVRIFECEEGFGSFVRGKNVTVGDFPERDLMDSDDEGDEGKAEHDEDEI